MNGRTTILVLSAVLIAVVLSGCVEEVSDHEIDETLRKIYGDNATLVTASEDELLAKYEKSDKVFKKTDIGDMVVYRHQRMVDGAIVEKDRIVYQFDKDTKELIKKTIHWRDDLPEHLPQIITKEEAESIAGGGSATLYFISPESHVVPIKPTPDNPCWEVWKVTETDEHGTTYYDIIIVDAVEGKILGHGVPPP
ncbi:MAG: hypothetical protein DIAAKJNI_00526 [Candidatus Argoarchaeum ethanivorans]|uniref:Uncharacterized protein n=1 Tax=Candidatus Argoarchaeum ethanivorans TaxID=2608793 RepID=A0A811T8J8_9EURY|nr:MAG: hypothetical protein DIAAKJNI_00526 [Candidatus Argoarchaeum ethanivorans]